MKNNHLVTSNLLGGLQPAVSSGRHTVTKVKKSINYIKVGDYVKLDPNGEFFVELTKILGKGPWAVTKVSYNIFRKRYEVELLGIVGSLGLDDVVPADSLDEDLELKKEEPMVERTKASPLPEDWKPTAVLFATKVMDDGGPEMTVHPGGIGPSPYSFPIDMTKPHDLVKLDVNPVTNLSRVSDYHKINFSAPNWYALRHPDQLVVASTEWWEFYFKLETTKIPIPGVKEGYEANKKNRFCVRCNKQTEKTNLFLSTIRYCPCVEEK